RWRHCCCLVLRLPISSGRRYGIALRTLKRPAERSSLLENLHNSSVRHRTESHDCCAIYSAVAPMRVETFRQDRYRRASAQCGGDLIGGIAIAPASLNALFWERQGSLTTRIGGEAKELPAAVRKPHPNSVGPQALMIQS